MPSLSTDPRLASNLNRNWLISICISASVSSVSTLVGGILFSTQDPRRPFPCLSLSSESPATKHLYPWPGRLHACSSPPPSARLQMGLRSQGLGLSAQFPGQHPRQEKGERLRRSEAAFPNKTRRGGSQPASEGKSLIHGKQDTLYQ